MSITQRPDPLDGIALDYLPDDLGDASDFEFTWGDIAFVQRVWERQVEPGIWRVDLQVQTLRGKLLEDLDALRSFLVEYHEKDDSWAPEPFGDRGFASERDIVALLEPGLAVEVRDPFGRQGAERVRRVAEGLRRLDA